MKLLFFGELGGLGRRAFQADSLVISGLKVGFRCFRVWGLRFGLGARGFSLGIKLPGYEGLMTPLGATPGKASFPAALPRLYAGKPCTPNPESSNPNPTL